MKAFVLKGFGGVENLVKQDLPVPGIGENEVLVEVKAISINPVDIKTRSGRSQAENLKKFDPIILGWDISGVVVDTGKSVTSFKTGDEVFGMVNFPGHGKAYAEFVAAPESHLTLKPSNITHYEAAAATLAALTAWQIFKEKIKLQPEDKILIHAAGGGVGHYAIQMARHFGARVTATASGEKREFVLKLGAERHIDYTREKFEDLAGGMDFVFDGIGGEYVDRSLKVLKPGGSIVTLPSGGSSEVAAKAAGKGMNGYTYLVRSNALDMKEIAGMLETGIIKSYVSAVYLFDDLRSAHRHIEEGKTRGKIVISL